MATTVTFPQASDAREIDTGYDDGDPTTGALRVYGRKVEIHPEDPQFTQFKSMYTTEIGGNLALFPTDPTVAGYNPTNVAIVNLYKEVNKLAPVTAEDAAKAKARAEAAAKEKAAAEARRLAEEEKRRAEGAAEAEARRAAAATEAEAQRAAEAAAAEAERLRAKAAAAEEAALQFSEAQNVSAYMPLAYGSQGMHSIPAEWFDAYVDGNAELSARLEPIRDTLYDPSTNYTKVSLANFEDVFESSFATDTASGESNSSSNLWEQGVNLMQSWTDFAEQKVIVSMAGDSSRFSDTHNAITQIVIPHFAGDTSYNVFEFTAQSGTEEAQIYTVYSFVDPNGIIDIRMALGPVSEGNTDYFLTHELLINLNAIIVKSPDKEIIQHGLKLARGLLEDGSAAHRAFDAQIALDD